MELECKQKHRIVCKKNKLIRHSNIKSLTTLGEATHGVQDYDDSRILSDGKWHRIEELQQRMELDEHKIQETKNVVDSLVWLG